MSDLRDFTGKNRKFTGTDSITVPQGTAAQEPAAAAGQVRFDTDKGVLTYNDGSNWFKVSSVIAVLSSVSGDITVAQNSTLTLTGTGFLTSNLVVTFTHSGVDRTVTVTPSSDTAASVDTPSALESAIAVGDTVAIKVTNSDGLDSGTVNKTVIAPPFGQQSFTSAGSYNWTAPSDVNSVSVVCVGGGGGTSHGNSSGGGGGGGLAYRNAIPVTPGQSYPIVVGAAGAALNSGNYTGGPHTGNAGGQSSAFSCTAGGGGAGNSPGGSNGIGGSGGSPGGTNNGGGSGGAGGSDANNSGGPGGGGAGGYSGNGGQGHSNSVSGGSAGAGGGGGGGYAGPVSEGGGGGGGGVGILGAGPNGALGSSPHGGGGGGSGGSNGQAGHQPMAIHPVAGGGDGGNYGGGGGGQNAGDGETGGGAGGAVRIVYGYTSSNVQTSYPSNAQN